tara:strand:- start:1112 stop:1480 length:369 start_codon:yes stop_codon:yes gene_type:complete
MAEFGKRSEECLASCDERIQLVLREAIKHYDFAVIKGHRGEDEQNEAFRSGNSQLKFPFSKHNQHPSKAVDIVPYPVDWDNQARFKTLAQVIKGSAEKVGVEDIHWGYDLWQWDAPHWQLGK